MTAPQTRIYNTWGHNGVHLITANTTTLTIKQLLSQPYLKSNPVLLHAIAPNPSYNHLFKSFYSWQTRDQNSPQLIIYYQYHHPCCIRLSNMDIYHWEYSIFWLTYVRDSCTAVLINEIQPTLTKGRIDASLTDISFLRKKKKSKTKQYVGIH